jgi:hypothetical protein
MRIGTFLYNQARTGVPEQRLFQDRTKFIFELDKLTVGCNTAIRTPTEA